MSRLLIAIALLAALLPASARQLAREFRLDVASSDGQGLPPSNGIGQIRIEGTTFWIGTSKGVARSRDFGHTWQSFRTNPAFANDGIFAMDSRGDTVWASTGFDTEIAGGDKIQTGSGYGRTTDGGVTWKHVAQPVDTCIQLPSSGNKKCQNFLPIPYGVNTGLTLSAVTTKVSNVSYDVSLTPQTVWVASWAGGLRKSTNDGQTWERIPLPLDNMNSISDRDTLWYFRDTDTLRQDTLYPVFDVVANDNLKAFGVHSEDGITVWCGTAGGINRSTDGGRSWTRFTNKNQVSHMLSNWVYRIAEQHFGSVDRIWATNWRTNKDIDQPEDYGVSFTDDQGRTWTNALRGVKAYNFAFRGSVAYITSDQGLYRTSDGGASFDNVSNIYDASSRQVIATSQFVSVGTFGDTVYVGSDDGFASTVDNGTEPFGKTWDVSRSYAPVGASATTYAYPNPFSPGFEPVRIHYGTQGAAPTAHLTVDIDIFDFGMNRVKILVHGADRSGSEFDELWDGRDETGKVVPNGTYFYRLKVQDHDPQYGKILVLQ